MPEIVLLAHPDGRFTALYDGRPLVTSRCPFFDAARRLLELGFRPDELPSRRCGAVDDIRRRQGLGARALAPLPPGGEREITPTSRAGPECSG